MKKMSRRLVFHLTLLWVAAVLTGATASSRAAARPTLSITNLKAGEKLLVPAFTVTGQAAGRPGVSNVSNVLCSLNAAAWTNAVTGNNWTNWSAPVTLIPGTNTFSACAVDDLGGLSQTDTVKFIYYVTGSLTVLTTGPGTVSPDYNGAQLQIGAGYSMTAKSPKPGFGLKTWTDGSNNLISTASTLKFIMASNLTFIANFGDVVPPTIDVQSSTASPDGFPPDYIVHGTASDKAGVTKVFYQLTPGNVIPGAWQTATTTNNWTNWTAAVSLSPGANNFYAYAVDAISNSSQMFAGQINYDSAPVSLSGQSAVATASGGNSLFSIAFDKNTFSLLARDSNHVNGVGGYAYNQTGIYGSLKLAYATPPAAKGRDRQTFALYFDWPQEASFSTTISVATNLVVLTTNNLVVTTNLVSTNLDVVETGYLQFSSVSNLAFVNVAGQLIWLVGSRGNADGLLFQKNTYTSQALLSAATNAGAYTYARYSPVGSLFKLTGTNGTSYLQVGFDATNYGSYYEQDYTSSGQTNGADSGRFIVASQNPAGNAPPSLASLDLHVFNGDGDFNEQFGPDTYSQASLTTNFDNAVGGYTYTNPGANLGQLALTVAQPPTFAGSNSAARLLFVGGNVGLFTNDDGTFSSFVMTTATNLAPAGLTNTTLSVGFPDSLQFSTNGNFTYYYQYFYTYTGTYAYTPFSPGGAMVQLTYLGASNNITGLDWLQLNFTTTNSGSLFWSQFDSATNFYDNYSGTFTLQQ